MSSQKNSVNQQLSETLLSWVKSAEIAIPEIQRPFLCDATKVRYLMQGRYQGFPLDHVIVWRNPEVKLKHCFLAKGASELNGLPAPGVPAESSWAPSVVWSLAA